MNLSPTPRKTLTLTNTKSGKIVLNKSELPGASGSSYRMDDWSADNRLYDARPGDNRAMKSRFKEDRGNRYGQKPPEEAVNKIRRGPGRRLAKEKRIRSMDPALMQKYAALSSSLQEKVNATIEIYYQQQMAKAYKGEISEAGQEEEDAFQDETAFEPEENFEPLQTPD